jgi:2-keto-4-pentenoate hydratase/2-oxohepta-3-ene-1,7-dioic acid hydratase in catechol pathway
MRLGCIGGRAVLIEGADAIDVAVASAGRFGPTPSAVYDEWEAFRDWATTAPLTGGTGFSRADLESPSPTPRQVFGIGINYRSHSDETGIPLPEVPAVFTKFPGCLAGADTVVELPADTVDWEVELVVVLGRRADRVGENDAWSYVAGVCVGQDLSERTVQFAAGVQFSLGKSYRGFGPMGPWLVTVDELDDPDDLALGCSVNGETMQDDRTSGLIYSVPSLIARLSAVLPLLPGDVIFTGTPAGVGQSRTPPRFLAAGDVIDSWVDGVGSIRSTCVSGPPTA